MSPQPASPRRESAAVVAVAAVAAILLYLGAATWPDTPDGYIHLVRVQALSEALRTGVILPRLFPDLAYAYGYPTLYYYAPASYYPPAILRLAGIDVLTATRLTLAALLGLSTWAMVRLARRWASPPAALAAGIVFVAFTYRLYDLFVRGALPEFAAFLWLPLLAGATAALASQRLDAEARRHRESQSQAAGVGAPPMLSAYGERPDTKAQKTAGESGGAFVAVALIWAGLLLTHNLTAMMAGGIALLCALIWLLAASLSGQARPVAKALVWVMAAWVVGALIAAWYVLPALLDAAWVGIGGEDPTGYTNHFATWGALFTWQIPFPYPGAAESIVPLPAFVALIGIAAAILLCTRATRGARIAIGATLSALVVSLWLTTASSAFMWSLLQPLLGRLQFPWRWQTIVAPASALLVAFLLHHPLNRTRRRWQWAAAVVVSAVILLISLGGLRWQPAGFTSADVDTEGGWAWDSNYGQVGVTWAGEFLPRWVTEQRWAISHPPETPAYEGLAPVSGSLRLVEAGYQRARYESAGLNGPLTFHHFYFPTWRVTGSGASMETAASTSLGLLQVPQPPAQGEVELAHQATASVWIGRGLTALGWAIVAWMLWRGRRRALYLTLWCAAGMVAVFAATGWSEVISPSQPMQADYGAVQLAGVVTAPVRAGETATIRPHWFLREPGAEWTVFVHLLDAAGEVVAQRDEPLGSVYTPPGRLVPGEVVNTPIFVPIPAGLAAGEYVLRLGLYPTGQPETPLVPEGAAQPWVQGTLEVRP